MWKPKIKRLTKNNLREYLANNPQKTHQCGDETNCVLANYFAHTADDFHTVEVKPVDGGGEVVGTAVFYRTNPHSMWWSNKAVEKHFVPLPKWANDLANAFDGLDEYGEDKRFRSTSILKRLGKYLGV